MEELNNGKALTECAECTWDYIDRLRMALVLPAKNGMKPERNFTKPRTSCAASAETTVRPITGPVMDAGGRRLAE